MSRNEFADWLMTCWYEGKAGEWAKDLAIQIQDELFEEVYNA